MLYHLQKHNRAGAFEPEEVKALAAAFDQAWRAVQESGTALASNGHAAALKELIALRIMEKALEGERDAARLRDDALLHLARTNLKSSGL